MDDLGSRFSPRTLLLIGMGLLAVQGAVLLGVRLLTPDGTDVVHPSVHLVTGLVGVGLYRRPRDLFGYGVVFGIGYLALGVLGALRVLDYPWFPLGVADHTFHIAYGSTVLLVATAGLRSRSTTLSPNTS